jgi:hypothetical protein
MAKRAMHRWIHALAHWLDVNAWVPGSEIRDGRRVQGDRCVGCGRFVGRGD